MHSISFTIFSFKNLFVYAFINGVYLVEFFFLQILLLLLLFKKSKWMYSLAIDRTNCSLSFYTIRLLLILLYTASASYYKLLC